MINDKNTGFRPSSMKKHNQQLLYKCIFEEEPISRIELTELTGLAPTTVTNNINELIDDGLIKEAGYSESSQGRRRVLLKIVPDAYYVIGVDLDRTGYTVVFTDLKANIIRKYEYEKQLNEDSEIVLEQITEIIDEMIESVAIDKNKLLGVGIGAPGPLAAEEGTILNPPNFANWNNIQVSNILEERLSLPVFLNNDADACAKGEKLFGCARKKENFVYIAAGSGIGSVYFENGHFHKGNKGRGGEIGHTTINLDGPQCSCGNIGCLELYISIFALKKRYHELYNIDPEKKFINKLSFLDKISKDAREKEDERALTIIKESARYLGTGIVNLVNILSPKYVILGREIPSRLGNILLEEIEKIVDNRSILQNYHKAEVLLAELDKEAPAIGAVSIVINEFINGFQDI
ncbi:MAG: ROK family protein [Halanaerobiales bacterium]